MNVNVSSAPNDNGGLCCEESEDHRPAGRDEPETERNMRRSRNPAELADELGLDGAEPPGFIRNCPAMTASELAVSLHYATGGWVELARTVLDIAEQTTLPNDVNSTSFADYVATLSPRLELGLTGSDERVATVLSHLSSFSKQTAVLALSSIDAEAAGGIRLHDAEGVLMRLQMAGILVFAEEQSGRKFLRIPMLLAAVLRRDAAERETYPALVADLVGALAGHLENSQAADQRVLSDVLGLARRSGLWSVLIRLQEAFGLSMFLLDPWAVCGAYAGLPAEALASEPELEVIYLLAEELVAHQENEITREAARDILVQETRAGQMGRFFPGDPLPGRSRAELGGERMPGGFGTIGRIIELAQSGHHASAASTGLNWSGGTGANRAHLVIRFLTAVSLFHSAEPQRALSILHEIEPIASSRHIDGDFLLPAITAWSALVAASSGDHERADRYLERLADEIHFPVIIDELVHPPMHIAAALRALDRLDLKRAREELDLLTSYPQHGSLSSYIPVISRTVAILGATSEPELLFVTDETEEYQDPVSQSVIGRDLVRASRVMVFIGMGQLKWAEAEGERLSANFGPRIVLGARIELISGRSESAIVMADTWFYHQSLTPKSRAELAAIKAAALLRTGRESEASAEFHTAISLSAWVSSLLPLALLPLGDRARLLELTRHVAPWDEAFSVFSRHFGTKDDLIAGLQSVGAMSVERVSLPELSSGELRLLELLSQGLTITQISSEVHQVAGTVKNRLSVLYHKFGVAGRDEVIKQARQLGFLRPG